MWGEHRTRRRSTLSGAAALLVGASMGIGTACTRPDLDPRPPIKLSLRLATRASCGNLSGLDYDTGCLAAIYLRALGENRQTLVEDCVTLTDRPADLRELLSGEPSNTLEGLSANQVVTFEVRGLHDTGLTPAVAATLCDQTDLSDRWLFWGESAPIDLATYDSTTPGSTVVPLVIDCRDCAEDCAEGRCFGCNAMDDDVCPATFPPSFCVPAVDFVCAKRCDSDDDCFEGARACVTDRCDVTDPSGPLCAPCNPSGGAACAEGYTCVGPPGAQNGFCAEPCPDTPCVNGTKCTRVGNNLDVID